MIAAAAVGRTGQRAADLGHGSALVLAAPGDDISIGRAVTAHTSTGSGTSGAAALISRGGGAGEGEVPEHVRPRDLPPPHRHRRRQGRPRPRPEYGYGIVNPVKALTADVAPLHRRNHQRPRHQPHRRRPARHSGAGLPTITLLALGVGVLLLVGLVILAVVLATRRRPP